LVNVNDVVLKRLHVGEVKGIMSHIQALWDEVDQRNTTMTLDPDYALYELLEAQNGWFFYTAEYEGKLSLYSFLIQPSLHVKGTKQLSSDFIYVDPAHRGKGIADILLAASEDRAKQEGVKIMSINLKEFDKHDKLVGKMGYTHYENTYQRII